MLRRSVHYQVQQLFTLVSLDTWIGPCRVLRLPKRLFLQRGGYYRFGCCRMSYSSNRTLGSDHAELGQRTAPERTDRLLPINAPGSENPEMRFCRATPGVDRGASGGASERGLSETLMAFSARPRPRGCAVTAL
jgi:hypothetical protein